jgi:hypothetical protein
MGHYHKLDACNKPLNEANLKECSLGLKNGSLNFSRSE